MELVFFFAQHNGTKAFKKMLRKSARLYLLQQINQCDMDLV